ncbi:hypothetical protein Mgra_00000557, partial [Meloidogyne graminicola]
AEKPNTENTFIGNSDTLGLGKTAKVEEIKESKRTRRGFWRGVGAGALIGGGSALAYKAFKG